CFPTDKATLIGSHFSANSSVYDSSAPVPQPLPLSNPIPSLILPSLKFHKVLCSLKTYKASGPDGIPARFLKEFVDELAPIFLL
ncbi:hypothetical protein SK128_014276, partial [Halocaridina rubra]